jgi:hypothetical protein
LAAANGVETGLRWGFGVAWGVGRVHGAQGLTQLSVEGIGLLWSVASGHVLVARTTRLWEKTAMPIPP